MMARLGLFPFADKNQSVCALCPSSWAHVQKSEGMSVNRAARNG